MHVNDKSNHKEKLHLLGCSVIRNVSLSIYHLSARLYISAAPYLCSFRFTLSKSCCRVCSVRLSSRMTCTLMTLTLTLSSVSVLIGAMFVVVQTSAEMNTHVDEFFFYPATLAFQTETSCNKGRIMLERSHVRHNDHCKHEKNKHLAFKSAVISQPLCMYCQLSKHSHVLKRRLHVLLCHHCHASRCHSH